MNVAGFNTVVLPHIHSYLEHCSCHLPWTEIVTQSRHHHPTRCVSYSSFMIHRAMSQASSAGYSLSSWWLCAGTSPLRRPRQRRRPCPPLR